MAERLRRALDDAWETVRWVAGFDFPDAVCDADLLALLGPTMAYFSDRFGDELASLVAS